MTEAEWLKGTNPLAMCHWVTSPSTGRLTPRLDRLLRCAIGRAAWANLHPEPFRKALDEADSFDGETPGPVSVSWQVRLDAEIREERSAYSESERQIRSADRAAFGALPREPASSRWNEQLAELADRANEVRGDHYLHYARLSALHLIRHGLFDADRGAFGRMFESLLSVQLGEESAEMFRKRIPSYPGPQTGEAGAVLAKLIGGTVDGGRNRRAGRRLAGVLYELIGNPFHPIDFRWRTADVTGLARGIYDDRAFDRLPILADALTDAGCDEPTILEHCREPGPHYRGCWVVDAVLRWQ
jgi:hypothetical protein